MLSIYDAATAATALDQPLDPALRTLITDRLHDAQAMGLADQTHILAVQPGDSEEDIQDAIGWSPLVDPDGSRFGTAEFRPHWSWLQDLGGAFELICTVGNSGFAYILIVEDALGGPADLLRMCRVYAAEVGGCAS